MASAHSRGAIRGRVYPAMIVSHHTENIEHLSLDFFHERVLLQQCSGFRVLFMFSL